jgi:hypothetical protein
MRNVAILASLLMLNTLVNLSSRYLIEKRIEAIEQKQSALKQKQSELDLVIQHYLKDPEQWQRVKSRLK